MTQLEQDFHGAMAALEGARPAKMFGWPGYKVGGKFFAYFGSYDGIERAVFKLPDEMMAEALELPGAQRFDPGRKGRYMRAWVEVPAPHAMLWAGFAAHAHAHVLAGAP